MKKITLKSKSFIWFSLFLLQVGPYLLKALCIGITKNFLNSVSNFFMNLIMYLIAVLFLGIGIVIYQRDKDPEHWKLKSMKLLSEIIISAGLCLAFLYCLQYAPILYGTMTLKWNMLGVVLSCVGILLQLVLLAFTIGMIVKLTYLIHGIDHVLLKSRIKSVGMGFLVILYGAFVLIIHFILPMAYKMLLTEWQRTFFTTLCLKVICCVVYWWLACSYYKASLKNIQKRTSKNLVYVLPVEKEKLILQFVLTGIFAIVLLVSMILSNDFQKKGNAADFIARDLEEIENDLTITMSQDDIMEYYNYYEKLCSHVNMLNAAIDGDKELLQENLDSHYSDEFLQMVYGYSRLNTDEIERCLYDSGYRSDYLKVYVNLIRLSEEDEADKKKRCRDAIDLCIANEDYLESPYCVLSGLKEEKKKISSKLEEYDNIDQYFELYGYAKEAYISYYVSDDTINRVIDIANEFPDDLSVQLTAAIISGYYYSEGSWFYNSNISIAKRIFDLANEELDQKKDAEIKKQIRFFVLNKLVTNYDYTDALEIINLTDTKDSVYTQEDLENLVQIKLMVLDNLGKYDEAIDYALSVKSSPYTYYYHALENLKLGNISDMITSGGQIEKYFGNEAYSEEITMKLLYSLCQYLAISDGNSGFYYKTDVYESYEAQIQKYPVFNALYLAVKSAFQEKDYEKAKNQIAYLLQEHHENSILYYMLGTIFYSEKDDEYAERAFLTSLEYDPTNITTIYELALLYDRMHRYQEAYAYCCRVLAIMPQEDHGQDEYGISVHAKMLKNDLKSYVEKSEKEYLEYGILKN